MEERYGPPRSTFLGFAAGILRLYPLGAPTDVAFQADDEALATDPNRNNDFSYTFPNDQDTQERCPFAAHVRKTNPRADLEGKLNVSTEPFRIIRSGIAFGQEVSEEEAANAKTTKDRGLLFVAYQSNIKNGFQFLQQSKSSRAPGGVSVTAVDDICAGWANAIKFPPKKPIDPGFDPIIGQAPDEGIRTMSGSNPKDQNGELQLDSQFVVPKGGEYFFSPSIPALKQTFALAA